MSGKIYIFFSGNKNYKNRGRWSSEVPKLPTNGDRKLTSSNLSSTN